MLGVSGTHRALAAALVLGSALTGCARTRPAERSGVQDRRDLGRPYQEGLATYYANRFAGRRTASGDRYDPGELTAAHRTLPFGTLLHVERVDGQGRAVIVRVNDRGPYARGRILDLSLAAARRLDMLREGVVRVRIHVVGGPDPGDQRRTSLYIGPSWETR